jgi:hypothetical protein
LTGFFDVESKLGLCKHTNLSNLFRLVAIQKRYTLLSQENPVNQWLNTDVAGRKFVAPEQRISLKKNWV